MESFKAFLKTLFPAVCAIVVFGFITLQIRGLDSYIPVKMPLPLGFGVFVMIAGAVLAFVCFALFAANGMLTKGQTFPDPVVFVCTGPYRYTRNPMAIGGLTTLFGWGLVERSPSILLFAGGMAVLMHYFIILVEEPKLERRFGQSYLAYKASVSRWIPFAHR